MNAKKAHSLRRCINEKCKECIFDPHGETGTWRQQVTLCTSWNCPLYPVRPLADAVPEFYLKKVRCNPEKMDARSRALIVTSESSQEGLPPWQEGAIGEPESTICKNPTKCTA